MTSIVLASSSPRRRDMLSRFNINFKIVTSNLEEKINLNDTPEIAAMALAFQKANDVASKSSPDEIVIGADTVVYLNKILGKPQSREEAFEMIRELNGNTHYVITGVAAIKADTNKKIVDFEKTKVKFKALSEEKIRKYIDTEEYKDKAGGYGIQGYGSLLVDWIEGSYTNVVGLPISMVDSILEKHFNVHLL